MIDRVSCTFQKFLRIENRSTRYLPTLNIVVTTFFARVFIGKAMAIFHSFFDTFNIFEGGKKKEGVKMFFVEFMGIMARD